LLELTDFGVVEPHDDIAIALFDLDLLADKGWLNRTVEFAIDADLAVAPNLAGLAISVRLGGPGGASSRPSATRYDLPRFRGDPARRRGGE
jgi:hypothetical protein